MLALIGDSLMILNGMAFVPQRARNDKRINFALLPPSPLFTGRMVFGVVNCTKRHGEFIADFESQTPWLRIANVMCMGRGSSADKAGLAGYEV